jgi:hypothetical protein
MSSALRITLESRPLERAEAEIAVAGFFQDHRPLRGGAARVDWRLCGLLSQLLMAGELSGERGEAVLMPSARHLRAPRILLLGLGRQADYRVTAAQDLMRDAIARCLALGLTRVAMAPLGIASDDLPRHAQAVVGGALEATRAANGPLDLTLTVSNTEIERSEHALEAAVRAANAPGLQVRSAPRPVAQSNRVATGVAPAGRAANV